MSVEVGAEVFEATAIVTTGEERAALFELCAAQPQLALYQTRTTRQIPAVALTRRERPL